jgi:hypothetical protein
LAAAIFLLSAESTEITKNTSKNDGSFVVLDNCTYTFVDHNQGRDFGAQGSLPWQSFPPGIFVDAAIYLTGNNEWVQINDNDLEKGKKNGIAFNQVGGGGIFVCEWSQVSYNTVKQFADNGIVAEKGITLFKTAVSGNDVEDNGNDGILIESEGGGGNTDNTLFDNKAVNNQKYDCEDNTAPYGPFTAQTYNTWLNNIGSTSLPAGICAARGWHH